MDCIEVQWCSFKFHCKQYNEKRIQDELSFVGKEAQKAHLEEGVRNFIQAFALQIELNKNEIELNKNKIELVFIEESSFSSRK